MDKKTKSTILVVDDDKRILRSFKLWLTKEGYNVVVASNGNEAYKHTVENSVDVALIDFRISKEDGISVAQKVREVDEDIKIVILTGFPSYETAVQSMKIGVFDYLGKGSGNDTILAVVKKAISERQQTRLIKEKNKTNDNRTRIILFCGHSLIKESLENYLKNNPEFKLVKTYTSLDSSLGKNVVPDVHVALICATCNLKLFSDSYAVFPALYRVYPGIKTLLINENFTDQEKAELLKLGIKGFCPEDSGTEMLEKAIKHISKGELWASRKVTQLSLIEMLEQEQHPMNSSPNVKESIKTENNGRETGFFGLTAKEKEILKRISLGDKNKEIASELSITESTVKTHINRILKKMRVDSRTKAILLALEKKLF